MAEKGQAFLVGIDEYEDEKLSNFEGDTTPTTDVKSVIEWLELEASQYQVLSDFTLLKQPITNKILIEKLTTFLGQKNYKNVLIYFSGHGYQTSKTTIDGEKKQVFLGTSDSELFYNNEGNLDGERNGLDFEGLSKLIGKAEHLNSLVLWIDACHSGSAIQDTVLKSALSAFNSLKCSILVSSLSSEKSYSGVFTKKLVEILSDKQRGSITADMISKFVYDGLKNSKQHPLDFSFTPASIEIINYPSTGSQVLTIKPIVDKNGEPICPYKGFNSFDDNENDQEFFFGREVDIKKIRNKLNDSSFVFVIGASGSGKSSVVKAGLIRKQLRQQEKDSWIISIIKPGINPLDELKDAFMELEKQFKETDSIYNKIKNFRRSDLSNIKDFNTILEELRKNQKRYLLVIDQFEEVFTLSVSEGQIEDELNKAKDQEALKVQQRDRFLELVTSVSEDKDSLLKVVVTMRADFLSACLNHTSLKNLIEPNAIYITSLIGQDLIDAISKPAQRQGYTIEPDLLKALLEDVGNERGFLPLLEFTLEKLWQNKVDEPKPCIPLSAYRSDETKEIAGLNVFLNQHANNVYEYSDFDEENPKIKRSKEEQEWIRLVFLKLLKTGKENTDTRQRQPLSNFLTIVKDDREYNRNRLKEVIESLIKGRLLVSNQSNDNQREIDLAHEALIEAWDKFVKWRDEDRDVRRLAERLEDALQEWKNAPEEQKKDYLMMGALLAQVGENLSQIEPYLNVDPTESKNFYELSNDNKKEEIEKLKEAKTQAELRESAARVQNLIPTDPLGALLLAIETAKTNLKRISEKNQISEKELISVETLAQHPGSILGVVQTALSESVAGAIVPNVCEKHDGSVNSVAFSLDGQMIVSGTSNTAYFWDSSGKIMPKPKPFKLCRDDDDNNYLVHSIAFSSESKIIVSGSSDCKVRVWSFDGELLHTLPGHDKAVKSVALSRDGNTIVSGSEDKTIRLWNISGESIGEPLRGHDDGVSSVAFSPDGKTIVSGSRDKTIRLWNINGQAMRQPLRGHDDSVSSVAFSPNGQMIVSGSVDTTVRLWRINGRRIGEPLRGHDYSVNSVAFSPNGQMIVSGSVDTTVRLWSINRRRRGINGRRIGEPLGGHKNSVNCVAFSPNGQMIVSGSSDQTIIMWAFTNHNPIHEPLCGHKNSVNCVAFSPNGQMIVSGSSDETLRLWNSTEQSIEKVLRGHDGSVNYVAFSPNGQMIVSGSSDKTLRLWNSTEQSIKKVLRGHKYGVNCVAFSPNGQMIVSGSSDYTICLWDIQGQCISKVSCEPGYEISSVAFSPDGKMIISGSSNRELSDGKGNLSLWTINDNCIEPKPRWTEWRDNYFNCVAFSPNGKMIATGSSDGKLRLWTIEKNYFENTPPWDAHPGDFNNGVNCVAFSPDGQMIVSGGHDKVIRLWDIKGNPIGQGWNQHEGIVTSVAFSPNGKMIATGSTDKKIYLWRGGWRDWLEICCKRLAPIILKDPKIDMNESCEICVRYKFWSSADFAAILEKQGNLLTNSLQEVKKAEDKFKKAKEYAPDLQLEPEVEAKRLAALSWIKRLSLCAQEGQIKKEIEDYSKIDPKLDVLTAFEYNHLCWFGSLCECQDHPTVIAACEKAVKVGYRLTQGVAKALRSTKTLEERERNIKEAIDDFYAYINDESIDNKLQK